MLKYFSVWFLTAFFSVLLILSLVFVKASKDSFSSSFLAVVWAAIIILVVLFGIIAVSVFVKKAAQKRRNAQGL